MRANILFALAVLIALTGTAEATVFRFDTDPFAGSNALTTPGRQVVGGETFISFSPPTDLFSLEASVFGIGDDLHFFNGVIGDLPAAGVNTIVLRTFDNDANPATPFNAGRAADLIAAQITTPGAGFFIYFNQGLDLPRLVYSTDLNDNTADLKILYRMTNLTGASGQAELANFTEANFDITSAPESSTMALMGSGLIGAWLASFAVRRRKA